MNKNLTKTFIIVASHKPYKLITKDCIYNLIELNAINNINHFSDLRDDLGNENISNKNYCYCELTALYWAWKNVDYNIIGLCHYRRYFTLHNYLIFCSKKNVLTEKNIIRILNKYDFILPKRTKMKETNYEHSIHYYNDHHMDITRDVIAEYYPEYLEAFDEVMNRKDGHFFNMLIAKKNIADKYFEWLFDVLFKVEKKYKFICKDKRSVRVFGYIAENLIDVYILKNKMSFKEKNILYLERENIFLRIKNKFVNRDE